MAGTGFRERPAEGVLREGGNGGGFKKKKKRGRGRNDDRPPLDAEGGLIKHLGRGTSLTHAKKGTCPGGGAVLALVTVQGEGNGTAPEHVSWGRRRSAPDFFKGWVERICA